MLINSNPSAQITEQLPIKAIFSLVSFFQNSPETSEEITAEVIEIMNRCYHLSIIAQDDATELQEAYKNDFDLWKNAEKTQNLFFKYSEKDKFFELVAALQIDFKENGYINPMSMSVDFKIPDFVSNVIWQLIRKKSQQVGNKDLIVNDDTINKLIKNIRMSSLENELKTKFDWEEQSFTNGCGRLDLEGSPLLKPILPNFFKSLFVGSNKGHNMFLKNLLIDKQTILSFHPEKLVSSEFPKDKQVWESYFLNESIFLGYTNIDLDVLGLPLRQLEIHKQNLQEDFFNVNYLLLGQSDFDMTLLNLKNKKIFRVKKIVMYGCRAIDFFINTFDNKKSGPWG